MKIGGYATGMRFAGDGEFQRRAAHSSQLTNIPEVAYFRRIRPDSLTSSAETGRGTAARKAVDDALREKWKTALADFASGRHVDLAPMSVRGPVELRHIIGPKLSHERPVARARPDTDHARHPSVADEAPARPIFITGAPGSGIGHLYAALAHHPMLVPVPGAVWLTRRMRVLEDLFRGRDLRTAAAVRLVSRIRREVMPPFDSDWRSGALRQIGAHQANSTGASPIRGHQALNRPRLYGRWVDGSARYALHIEKILDFFPGARFVHVVREPDSVVSSISARGRRDIDDLTPAEAYAAWTHHVDACIDAERQFGSTVIRRLFHSELCASPERSIRCVLQFIGEPFASDCLTPVWSFKACERASRHLMAASVLTDPQLNVARVAAHEMWAAMGQ